MTGTGTAGLTRGTPTAPPAGRRTSRGWLGAARTARGGVLRHKVQAVVITSVLLIATASATLGLALLAASNGPFNHAFAAQHGAHVTVTANLARVTPAQLAGTSTVAGVTAVAGPFNTVTVQTTFQGQPNGQLTLAGRAAPGGPVDDLVLVAGHWPTGPGQLVLDGYPGTGEPPVGGVISVTGVPGTPSLTVVGYANSITSSAEGWVLPGGLAQLRAPGTPRTAQLLYRFASAGGAAQIRADVAAIRHALPKGAVAGASSWLAAQQDQNGNAAIIEPFVVAFALIGLAMAVLIVGNVVSGAVVAQYHRIGVLKSIGMTPSQVIAVYLGRIGGPALVGCLLGTVAGDLLAVMVLHQSAGAYGVGRQQAPWWAVAGAPVVMLALTALAALGPALRAGRLSAVEAIAAGRAPRSGNGYGAHRLASRLLLPRPVSLGLAAPFARPARTLVTLAAITFGATAVIFAVGLHSSLSRAADAQHLAATVPVQIQEVGSVSGPGPQQQSPGTAQLAAVTAALRSQPGTAHQVTLYGSQLKVPGIAQPVTAMAFDGPAAWTGYAMVTGRWYSAPGEVVVNTAFLDASALSVGDTETVNTGTTQVTVRITGEVFMPSKEPRILGSTRTLPGLANLQNFWQEDVALRPGTSTSGYIQAVNSKLGPNSPFAAMAPQADNFYQVAIGLLGLLSLMVAISAGLGVLNTVLMSTRDRVHDLGIFKTIGMRPGQLTTMVICWVVGPAVLAAVIAAPAAVLLNTATVHAMAGTAHTDIPASFTQVFPVAWLAVLSLAALAIAVVGALLPAMWAARARPATALRAE
jgi:putative ABC transport system permease protein